MNKKMILIVTAAGLLSFAGSFGIGWFLKPAPGVQAQQDTQAVSQTDIDQIDDLLTPRGLKTTSNQKESVTDKQMRNLVYDLQEKYAQYTKKLNGLDVQRSRIQIAHDMLQEDIDEMNRLYLELTQTVVNLRNQKDALEKSLISISQTERNNLITIASTYDKMDPESAGKILSNMGKLKNGHAPSYEDGIKILYYMNERAKAKLLAALTSSEPELAAFFCKKLKTVSE